MQLRDHTAFPISAMWPLRTLMLLCLKEKKEKIFSYVNHFRFAGSSQIVEQTQSAKHKCLNGPGNHPFLGKYLQIRGTSNTLVLLNKKTHYSHGHFLFHLVKQNVLFHSEKTLDKLKKDALKNIPVKCQALGQKLCLDITGFFSYPLEHVSFSFRC